MLVGLVLMPLDAVRFQWSHISVSLCTSPIVCRLYPIFIGTALLLGSWYGVLFGLILIGMIAIRALKEERMLLKELEGYDIYMAQVKYRFIPYVW